MPTIDLTSNTIRRVIGEIAHGVDWCNVHDYGIVANNEDPVVKNQNRNALQTLIDNIAQQHRNAVIFHPEEGKYFYDGDYQDTARSNCIIKFPTVGIQEKYFNITLKGFSKPTFSPSAYSTVPLPSATQLVTTKESGPGTRPSFFGGIGPAGGDNGECSYCTIGFQDMLILTPPNPQLTAVNMSGYTNVHTKNVGIVAGNSYGTITSTEPTNQNSFGFIQPSFGHGVYQRAEEILFILGFYNGIRVGENCVGDEVEVWACKNGVIYDRSYGVSKIHRISFGWVKNHFTWNAAHKIQIDCVNIERWEPPYGGVANRWYNFVADIVDPGNIGRGELTFQAARANIGEIPGMFTKPAGSQLYVREIGVAP